MRVALEGAVALFSAIVLHANAAVVSYRNAVKGLGRAMIASLFGPAQFTAFEAEMGQSPTTISDTEMVDFANSLGARIVVARFPFISANSCNALVGAVIARQSFGDITEARRAGFHTTCTTDLVALAGFDALSLLTD